MSTHPGQSAQLAWQLLQRCELGAAQAAFERLRESDRSTALHGLIAVAQSRRDTAALHRLLRELSAGDAPELILRAVDAALRDPALSELGRALSACAREQPGSNMAPQLAGSVAARRAWLERCGPGRRAGRNLLQPDWQDTGPLELGMLGSIPIVMISVDGAPEAAFLFDTGASLSVLTRTYARQLGIDALPGTEHSVNSPAGWLPTELARVRLRLGNCEVHDADVALLDLELPGIAGIFSPQSTLASCQVALNLRNSTLRVGRQRALAWPELDLPLVMCDGRPQLSVELAGSRRYFTLDTGADHSSMSASFAGPALVSTIGVQSSMHNAGGRTSSVRSHEQALELRVAGVRWLWERPASVPAAPPPELPGLESAGTIGMDFLMGRELHLDPARSRLGLSERAELQPWPVGSSASFRIEGSCFPEPREIIETVVSREAERVRLRLELPRWQTRIEIDVSDSWRSRGTFLATRPSLAVHGSAAELESMWQRVFVPFRPSTRAPAVRWKMGQLHGRSCPCTELLIDVEGPHGSALLGILSVSSDPWQVCRVELGAASGELLWRYQRAGFEAEAGVGRPWPTSAC